MPAISETVTTTFVMTGTDNWFEEVKQSVAFAVSVDTAGIPESVTTAIRFDSTGTYSGVDLADKRYRR